LNRPKNGSSQNVVGLQRRKGKRLVIMSEYELLALYFVAKQELCFEQTGMVC